MDPTRDGAGSTEQDTLDALRKEELGRAQSAAQARQASSRPSVPMRLPLGPPVFEDKSARSQSSMEIRLKNLEACFKDISSFRAEGADVLEA
jgi:hypothetical protein